MKRITVKTKSVYTTDVYNVKIKDYDSSSISACLRKLGKLEDIEGTLGISLQTLFKALIYGCWYIDEYTGAMEKDLNVSLCNTRTIQCYNGKKSYPEKDTNKLCLAFGGRGQFEKLTNYGKTWGLLTEAKQKMVTETTFMECEETK